MSTLPNDYPLSVKQGDTFVLAGTYKEGETVDAAVAVSLTGATMKGQIRKSRSSTSTLICSFTVAPDADQSGNKGVWSAILSAADAALLVRKRYYYDIQITWGSGAVQTILAGPVNVTPEVTT